jgi:hypothetical protein
MACSLVLDMETAKELDDSQKQYDEQLSTLLDSKIEELIEKRASEILEEKIKALK